MSRQVGKADFFSGCGKRHITHKEGANLSRTQRELKSQSSDRGNIVKCQLSSTFDSRHRDCPNKYSPKGGDNPSEMNMFNIGIRTQCAMAQGNTETDKYAAFALTNLITTLQTSKQTCSHSGCDQDCQKLIHRWLCTTAQRIETQWLRVRYV